MILMIQWLHLFFLISFDSFICHCETLFNKSVKIFDRVTYLVVMEKLLKFTELAEFFLNKLKISYLFERQTDRKEEDKRERDLLPVHSVCK